MAYFFLSVCAERSCEISGCMMHASQDSPVVCAEFCYKVSVLHDA